MLNNMPNKFIICENEVLTEAGEVNSFSKVSAASKKTRGIAAKAFSIAKGKDDILFKKSQRYKGLWKKATASIVQKYKSQATKEYLDAKQNKNKPKDKKKD